MNGQTKAMPHRLFENTFPNTLDTTIKWFNDDLTFVVTGDIEAEWLRDSSNQFKAYLPLVGKDPALQNLTRGVINLQGTYAFASQTSSHLRKLQPDISLCFLTAMPFNLLLNRSVVSPT